MPANGDRYEFRAFARDFGIIETRLRAWASPAQIRESDEIYFVAPDCIEHNVKYRGGVLDIKTLVSREGRLEQWTPRSKTGFPLTGDWLAAEFAPALALDATAMPTTIPSARALVETLVYPTAGLLAVRVFKRRFSFTIDGCMAEIAEVEFNTAALRTACVEGTDADAVETLIDRLGLDVYANLSYLQAIRQVTGLSPIPLPLD
ncbi:MAG: hypothetical protein JJU27_12285 [Gammaproteobacteria bacterium]|nr:hypothetical protein [Gammaproteobacteria bacterium]